MIATVAEQELAAHGVYVSVTSGVSMRPLFRTHRDTVILARPEGTLSRGDVALYRVPSGKLVLHRILAVRDGEYLCRGDNTYRVEHIPFGDVIGVLTAFRRGKGRRHEVTERGYRFYVCFWQAIYPIRYVCHAVYRFFFRMAHGVFRAIFRRGEKKN